MWIISILLSDIFVHLNNSTGIRIEMPAQIEEMPTQMSTL